MKHGIERVVSISKLVVYKLHTTGDPHNSISASDVMKVNKETWCFECEHSCCEWVALGVSAGEARAITRSNIL